MRSFLVLKNEYNDVYSDRSIPLNTYGLVVSPPTDFGATQRSKLRVTPAPCWAHSRTVCTLCYYEHDNAGYCVALTHMTSVACRFLRKNCPLKERNDGGFGEDTPQRGRHRTLS